MSDTDRCVVDGIVVEEEIEFTFSDMCRACGVDHTQMFALVGEGVLDPVGNGPENWLFPGTSLRTARAALRLARELELSLAGAAVVLELLDEIDALRSRLRQAGER